MFACRAALNASGNISFFKRYQLVAVLVAEWEPHLMVGRALKMTNLSTEYTWASIHKCTQTHSKRGRQPERVGPGKAGGGHKRTDNSKMDLD